MLSILGGLGAAVLWATATVCSSRSSRLIGAGSALGWVMAVGLAVTLPAAIASGVPPGLDGHTLGLLITAGMGNVVGLFLEYRGFRVGKVGIVAPIASTEGAVAAVIAIAAGEQIVPGAGAMLAVIVAGVAMAGMAPDADGPGGERSSGAAALLGLGAALSFGVGIYATGRVSQELPVVWAVLPARVIGVTAVTVPLALTSRLQITRRAVPFVAASGLGEVGGFVLFAFGARQGIAVTAVLASLFAAFSAVAAWALFHERLTRIQTVGVAMIVVGVAVLTALTA
jgi:drug/metabolite transporter (DMT)-like permease